MRVFRFSKRRWRAVVPLLVVAACWSQAAGATMVTSLLCGSDPAILTPIYPIRNGPSGPELESEPDVTFTFEGTRPCTADTCRIAVRHGGKLLAAMRLPSDELTFCREKSPFKRWPMLDEEKAPEGCRGGFYANSRMVVFRKDTDDIDVFYVPSVDIFWFQKKRAAGQSMFDCKDVMFGGQHSPDEYAGVLYVPTGNPTLVEIFEKENQDDVDTLHRHVAVPSDPP